MSEKTPLIKIGLTGRLPHLRVKELGHQPGYERFAPWQVLDAIEVANTGAAETFLHRSLRDRQVLDHPPATELFEISEAEARACLDTCPAEFLKGEEKLRRLEYDADLKAFLRELLTVSGLHLLKDLQGVWTLSLYPSTVGGRLFTLNIGLHEVAFATAPRAGELPGFSLCVDRLVHRSSDAKRWLRQHDYTGRYSLTSMFYSKFAYASASPDLAVVNFQAPLAEAQELLAIDGMRRALVAYWFDHLLKFRETGRGNMQSRWHNMNAVRRILQ